MAENNGKSDSNGLAQSISQLEQAVSASLRPLPTETGDGSYVKDSSSTGLVKDLSHIDLADIKTILDVIKSAATGDLIDDRKYITERVIQVSCVLDTRLFGSVLLTQTSLHRNCLQRLGMARS